jgi:hypothetical protein
MVVLVAAFWFIVAARRERETAQPPPPTLAELRRGAGVRSEREGLVGLLQRTTFVFVSTSGLERRLDHRIEDADGHEVGSVAQTPPPGRWTSNSGRPSGTVRVDIRDLNGTCIAQLVRPGGLFAPPFTVLDGTRIPVGFVKREGRRRALMTDVLGRPLGTIQRVGRQHPHRVDYAIEDVTGSAIGTISDFEAITARLAGLVSKKWLYGQADEHVLEITTPVEPDVRLLMLGAAAGVYLVLQRPASHGD